MTCNLLYEDKIAGDFIKTAKKYNNNNNITTSSKNTRNLKKNIKADFFLLWGVLF